MAGGRGDDARLGPLRQAVAARPGSGVARHNLAAALGDLGRHGEALSTADQALKLGTDAPETWLVKARAHLGLAELDAAEAAFRQSLRRRPDYADAHRDLAQLLWMCTADGRAALAPLDAAPKTPALLALRARVLEFTGDPAGAATAVEAAVAAAPADLGLRLQAANLAAHAGRAEAAAAHAEAALRLQPGEPRAVAAYLTALLGLGRAVEAAEIAQALLARTPHDQSLLALLATAWRLAGDPQWRTLWDEPFIAARSIEKPSGWPDLPSYLADLRTALRDLHGPLRTHPLEQSLRGGSQTPQNLQAVEHPAVRAFFTAIDAPIRAYLQAIGRGPGPLASRNTGDYAIKGVWSVRLRKGGNHVDHTHSEGWISSAFYVDLPRALDTDRQGWIRFGRPPFPTRPALEPFLHLRPEPGRLVLFPSYLWHGTEPFTSDEERLTIAFDLVPA